MMPVPRRIFPLFFVCWAMAAASYAQAPRAVDVPPGFAVETLATGLNAVTALAVSPDGRIFIADQTGSVLVLKHGSILPEPMLKVAVDDYWERGLVGLALHPDFPRTPHLFVLYISANPFLRHVLSRFTVEGDTTVAGSERVLLEGDDHARIKQTHPGGHQGGLLRFGNDGKLYVSVGELTGRAPAQDLSELQGKILRLNPDGSIPDDNPFVTRTEGKYRTIYALGVRNSFGIAVQPRADGGRMFFTDVGGSAFDEVNELLPGANYGWPQTEGPTKAEGIVGPLYAYPPITGRSVCGGAFYPKGTPERSAKTFFPARWRGQFFFADFIQHWVKALDPDDPSKVVSFGHGFNGPIAVEFEADGSMLVLNRGAIWRDGKKFVPNAGSLVRIRYGGGAAVADESNPTGGRFPARLSETGIFASLTDLRVATDFEAFELNAPVWLPFTKARRWLKLPSAGKIRIGAESAWEFPAGAMVVQHFSTAVGLAQPEQPLETHVYWATGDGKYRAAAYRWTEKRDDALLVNESAMTPLPGTGRPVQWLSPGPEPAYDPQTAIAGFVLQLDTGQLNRPAPDGQENQIARWARLGRFLQPEFGRNPQALPRAAALDDASATLETRVRSYLAANCTACHRPGGSSRGTFDARFSMPLSAQGLVGVAPSAGDLGIPDARLVVPGDPARSILLQRLTRTDFFRMPPIVLHNESSPAVSVIEAWIRSLPPTAQFSP